MNSYRPEELFDAGGRLIRDLRMPDCHAHAVTVSSPGSVDAQDMRVLGKFLRDVIALDRDQRNFRLFGPDETRSNLLGAVFEVTSRQWDAAQEPNDEFLAPAGRVMDAMLSGHQCQGWLEGCGCGSRVERSPLDRSAREPHSSSRWLAGPC